MKSRNQVIRFYSIVLIIAAALAVYAKPSGADGQAELLKPASTVVDRDTLHSHFMWGFRNNQGEWVIPAQYDAAKPFSEGLAPVGRLFKDDRYLTPRMKWGFINEQGRLVIPFSFDAVKPFSDGLSAVAQFPGKQEINDHIVWGYIDKLGTQVIPIGFDAAEPFERGKAAVASFDADPDRVTHSLRWRIIDKTEYMPGATPTPKAQPAGAFEGAWIVETDRGSKFKVEIVRSKDGTWELKLVEVIILSKDDGIVCDAPMSEAEASLAGQVRLWQQYREDVPIATSTWKAPVLQLSTEKRVPPPPGATGVFIQRTLIDIVFSGNAARGTWTTYFFFGRRVPQIGRFSMRRI